MQYSRLSIESLSIESKRRGSVNFLRMTHFLLLNRTFDQVMISENMILD